MKVCVTLISFAISILHILYVRESSDGIKYRLIRQRNSAEVVRKFQSLLLGWKMSPQQQERRILEFTLADKISNGNSTVLDHALGTVSFEYK